MPIDTKYSILFPEPADHGREHLWAIGDVEHKSRDYIIDIRFAMSAPDGYTE